MAKTSHPGLGGPFALGVVVLVACGKADVPREEPLPERPKRGGSMEACAIPDTSKLPPETHYTIPKGCKLRVEKDWVIQNDARVWLGEGVVLSFAKGTGLYVEHGRLDSLGSGEPVRFTSAEASPAPGDWRGIVVHQPTWGMAIDGDHSSYAAIVHLRRAIVEFAGADTCPALPAELTGRCTRCSRGAFTMALGSLGWQSLTGVTFRNDRDAHVDTTCMGGAFGTFEGNQFEGTGVPLRVRFETAPSLGEVSAPVVLERGGLTEAVALPKGDYRIERATSLLSLAIAEGSTVRIAPGVTIGGQTLLAKNVTFTWTGSSRWGALHLTSRDSSLDGCTFDHAGGGGAGAVIDLSAASTLHHVWDNKFSDLAAPAFHVTASVCAELERQNNVADKSGLCRK